MTAVEFLGYCVGIFAIAGAVGILSIAYAVWRESRR